MSQLDAPVEQVGPPAREEGKFPRIGRRSDGRRNIVSIKDVAFGGNTIPIIAGPCAVESQSLIDEAAREVASRGAAVLRGGAFKPRTSPDSFQGLGMEGVEMMRDAARAHEMPFVTEVMSPKMVEEMGALVDAFQVGARNMQNFALLEALGRADKPVLLKRHFGSTPTEWLMAAEHIASGGNERIILCERGIRAFGDETRFTLDIAGALWARKHSRLPVVVDPSHAIGVPELLAPAAAAAIAAGLDGVMVEVHPRPSCARCDADQALTPQEFGALVGRVKPFAVERPLATNTER